MATHNIKTATLEEVEFVLSHLRETDELELVGFNKVDLIRQHFKKSISFAGYFEGKAVCVYGVRLETSFMEPNQVWLASTNEIEKCWFRFIRENIKFVNWATKEFGVLGGVVAKKNVRSQRWLHFLGFTLGEEIDLPIMGPVYPFQRSLF